MLLGSSLGLDSLYIFKVFAIRARRKCSYREVYNYALTGDVIQVAKSIATLLKIDDLESLWQGTKEGTLGTLVACGGEDVSTSDHDICLCNLKMLKKLFDAKVKFFNYKYNADFYKEWKNFLY